MKQILITIFLIATTLTVSAQDIIFKKSGEEIKAKVQKVTETEIEYSKWSNLNGPKYTISLDNVFMVKYENGEKDVFNQTSSAKKEDDAQESVPEKAKPTADNATLIDNYNKTPHEFINFKVNKEKDASGWLGTLGVLEESVLSSEEVSISISQADKEHDFLSGEIGDELKIYYNYDKTSPYVHYKKYLINIKNNTKRTIYIDKGSCFRIDDTGKYVTYFNTQQTTVNHGGGSGASMNLGSVTGALGIGGVANTLAGGVNVGGGKSNSTSTTYTDQRVLSIPPNGNMVLSQDDYAEIQKVTTLKNQKVKVLALSEDFSTYPIPHIKRGEKKTFTESTSPIILKYILTFSYDPEFKTSTTQDFGVYLKDVVGTYEDAYRERIEWIQSTKIKNQNQFTIIVGGNQFR